MTPILEVITKYCDRYIDDVRLSTLKKDNPPLWARRMSNYFVPAVVLFNVPEEMPEYLLGTPDNIKLVEPIVADYRYKIASEQISTITIQLGVDFIGFEVFAAHEIVERNGNVVSIPSSRCSYDAEKAQITITADSSTPILAGTTFDFDFYTDGYFVNTLTPEMMNILGMCFQVIWREGFNEDWLSLVSKVEDNSFYEQNRANKERADTERMEALRRKLAGEMRRFEQNLRYKQTVPQSKRIGF